MLNVADRKLLYAMFAALFSYPDPALMDQLAAGELQAPAQRLPAAPPFPQFPEPPALEDLQVAYTGLFINRLGGVPAPPYGSVYLDDEQQLHGASTRAVAETYQAAGVTLDASTEPPDFLATELEFLYYLVGKEEDAFKRRELAAAQEAVAKQLHFLETFLAPWAGEFCRRVAAAEPHPFYGWAADALAGFLAAEKEWLNKAATLRRA